MTLRPRHLPKKRVLTLVLAVLVSAGLSSLSPADSWSQTPTKSNQIGFVIATKGTASLLSKSAMPRPATLRQEVYPDDTIKTGLNSSTKVLFDDQTMLSVTDNSEVGVKQYTSDTRAPNRNTILQMARGRVKAQVPDIYDAKDSRFEVRTPTAIAATRGADYVVWTYLQKGRVYTGVAVLAGTVEVTNPTGQSVTVAPGFFSLTSTEGFLSTPAPIQKDEQIQQLIQQAEVRTDPTVAPQVKLAQQQAPVASIYDSDSDIGAQTPAFIPGEQWVRFGAGGISRTMGTTNTPCTILSGSGNLPLGCTVHPLR